MRVDLPAPFSPRRQSTSPGIAARLIRSFARTPGKPLVMAMSSTAGVIPAVESVSPTGDTSAMVLRWMRRLPAVRAGHPGSYLAAISASTSACFGVRGTWMVPPLMPSSAVWAAAHASSETFAVLSSEMPFVTSSV